jgi:D-alanyl-lipoteichoic acid acyltransferase DltB (MBOAT superfamily)
MRISGMGKWKKMKRHSESSLQKEPLRAKVSLILLLLNVFIWAGLRSLDVIVLTFISALVALAGMLMARAAWRYIRRHRGSVGGESIALIGYWGNLIVFVLTFLLFSYSIAMGILRGELI